MKKHSSLSIIMTTLLVVAFGWGSAYLIITGIRAMGPNTAVVETDSQKALTLEAKIINPAVPEKTTGRIKILIGGDVMFDRGIRALGEKNGYTSLFDENIKTLFKKADIVAVNLEGPITSKLSKTLVDGKVREGLTFTFSSQSRNALKDAGISIVSLANNHTDNFGFNGFLETQDWLKDAGISWFGNPWNSTSTSMTRDNITNGGSPIVTIVEKNGAKIAFIGYHSFQKGVDRVIEEIKRVSGPKVFTIVMPHWGEEYTATSSEKMKQQARAFIAAGADAVIGAHPHVIMDQEWIGGIPVVYSVGNLLFDQYFSPEVMKGEIVELHLIQDSSTVRLESMDLHEIRLVKGKGVTLEIEPVLVR